jgi:hypothetical protein
VSKKKKNFFKKSYKKNAFSESEAKTVLLISEREKKINNFVNYEGVRGGSINERRKKI